MIPTVSLVRFDKSDQGVFGRLTYENFKCYTGELPDRNNANNFSCIPLGIYKVIWYTSPRLRKKTYRLIDVPGRGGILIHSANLMGDATKGYKVQLLGCIALGERLGYINKQKAILVSRPAVRRLEDIFAGKPFMLEVTEC